MLISMRLALAVLTAALCLQVGCGPHTRKAPLEGPGEEEKPVGKEEPTERGQPLEKRDVVEQHWPDGQLRLRKQVLRNPDGTLVNHGTYARWYSNGHKEYEAVLVRGKKHGTTTRWHKNGRKWSEQHYVNGQKHGASYIWDENGVKRKEEHHVQGKPHGTWTTWDSKGDIKWQGSFDRGVPQS